MVTTVTGKNQVTIPARLAAELGIAPGTRLEWEHGEKPSELRVRILPDRRAIANGLLGAGRKYIAPGGSKSR